MKRECRKLFFVTCDLKVLRDLWRTRVFYRYTWFYWFYYSILRDFETHASPPNHTDVYREWLVCDLQYGALTLPFTILLSLNTVFIICTNRSLKRVYYLIIFVNRENEIVMSAIRDPLFFLFVIRARDPPLRPSPKTPLRVNSENFETAHLQIFLQNNSQSYLSR